MDKQDRWTDEGPGEDPTLRRKQQFGQCLGNGEQASSTAEALQGSVPTVTVLSQAWAGIALSCHDIQCWAAELELIPLVLVWQLAGDARALGP